MQQSVDNLVASTPDSRPQLATDPVASTLEPQLEANLVVSIPEPQENSEQYRAAFFQAQLHAEANVVASQALI